jgi:hypothetical protein
MVICVLCNRGKKEAEHVPVPAVDRARANSPELDIMRRGFVAEMRRGFVAIVRRGFVAIVRRGFVAIMRRGFVAADAAIIAAAVHGS